MYKYEIEQSQIPDKFVTQETEYINLLKSHNPNFLGLYKVDKATDETTENLAYLLFDTFPTQQEVDELKTIVQNQDSLILENNSGLNIFADNMGDMTTPKFKLFTVDVFFHKLLEVVKGSVKPSDIKKLGVKTIDDVVVVGDTGTVNIAAYTTNRTEVMKIEFYDEVYPYKSGEFTRKVVRTPTEYETLVSSIFESIP